MTAANADTCISITIDQYEGGYDNDRRDRGNWTSGKIGVGELKGTKFGIASFAYPAIDIKSLTKSDAIAIYKRDYWPKVAGDILPEGIDFTAWDACVNSGSGRALKWLAAGLDSSITSAVGLANLAKTVSDKISVIKKANAARRSFLIGLHNSTYEKGWLKRVANVEARSIVMARQAEGKTGTEIKTELNAEAAASDTTKKTTGAGSGGTGTAVTAQASQHHWQWDWWTVGEVVLIASVVLIVAYLAYRALVEHKRAAEMRSVAKEII